MNSLHEIIDSFAQAMREHGIETDEPITADGHRHRVRVTGDKAGSENGWYVLHADGVPAGAFGCWKRGISTTWCAKAANALTTAEREAFKQRMEASRLAQQAEQERVQAECKAKADRLWREASDTVSASHPYLMAKGVKAYGLRQLRDALLVPVMASDGAFIGLQFIQADGSKRFLTGTPKAGSYHRIAGDMNKVLICEGYATGASLHEATGYAVAIAFDAGNLMTVATTLRAKLPNATMVLCADDDRHTEGNPGLTKATAAAHDIGGLLAVPPFAEGETGTDFNDLHQAHGLDAVREAVEAAHLALTSPPLADSLSAGEHQESEQETITRLAGLSDIAYYRVQEASATALGIKPSQLDKLVTKERKRIAEAGTQADAGTSVMFDDVEPWDSPVAGDELLDHMVSTIQRFTVLSAHQARACALWAAFTWFIYGANVAPLLNITSPEKRCGKSTLGDLIRGMVLRPLYASNISPPALFRSVEKWRPTLLIDEADAFLNGKDELRGILNAGHYRSTAFVSRVVGDALEPKMFITWGAKALIGIGKIADTLTDRSVVIELRRKLETESVEKLRHADPTLLADIRRKLARWSDDELAHFKAIKPTPIEAINDRAADNWEPLYTVALIAGGHWPKLCIEAAIALSGVEQEAPSTNVELLADIKAAFERKRVDRFSSADLLAALFEDEEAPWLTWNRGKAMSPRQLASRLSEFGIVSGSIRLPNGTTPKGYLLERFKDAFARYLSAPPLQSATTPQTSNGAGFSDFSKRHTDDLWRIENSRKPSNHAGCGVVADRAPPVALKAAGSDLNHLDEGAI